ncbi:MAG: hypothetical protein H5U08_06635 [Thermogutta sp.]|uniref:hypothetical protein n=1 Tax=Thermogutta sp. TaxID=1962930 RepID=UPI0019A80388|nr:hypothetical protein [Thermogutta sp.]MBC7352017.1 hypothetical protein [Thermogutta sp.]
MGDAFYDNPGSDTGFFPFAYSDEELLFGQGQNGAQQATSTEGAAVARKLLFAQVGHAHEHTSAASGNRDALPSVACEKDMPGMAEAVEIKTNGEAHAAGDGGKASTWRWWNPFAWFNWGIDWSEAVDEELAIVRQLNQTFGTRHTRLDQFTAEERARIEQALGQKFNWEAASAIRASELEPRGHQCAVPRSWWRLFA